MKYEISSTVAHLMVGLNLTRNNFEDFLLLHKKDCILFIKKYTNISNKYDFEKNIELSDKYPLFEMGMEFHHLIRMEILKHIRNENESLINIHNLALLKNDTKGLEIFNTIVDNSIYSLLEKFTALSEKFEAKIEDHQLKLNSRTCIFENDTVQQGVYILTESEIKKLVNKIEKEYETKYTETLQYLSEISDRNILNIDVLKFPKAFIEDLDNLKKQPYIDYDLFCEFLSKYNLSKKVVFQ